MAKHDGPPARATSQAPWRFDTTGGYLPNAHQSLLLGAALFAPQAARRAWEQWRKESVTKDPAGHRLRAIEPGSRRLLPLVHHNLSQDGGTPELDADPLFAQLKGHRQKILIRNQRHLYYCAQLLELFHAESIRTLVLKGAALIQDYYPDPSLRPMNDFDLLVPHSQARAAIDLLNRHGWHTGQVDTETIDEHYLFIRHGQSFSGNVHQKSETEGWTHVDLHWYALHAAMDFRLDEQLWAHAQPITIHGASTLVLCPTDQLIHICVHGAAWAPIPPPLRWIADAVMILRTAGPHIDWDRVCRLARNHPITLSLSAALGYLQNHILPHTDTLSPIPPSVLKELDSAPISAAEKQFFQTATRRSTRFGKLPNLWTRYRDYRARFETTPPSHRPSRRLNLIQFISIQNNQPDDVPGVIQWAANRSFQRLRRMILPG